MFLTHIPILHVTLKQLLDHRIAATISHDALISCKRKFKKKVNHMYAVDLVIYLRTKQFN